MKLGLALSGGGIKGVAHAGILKALEENDIKIDVIGGTSSGSQVAALYAMGYSPYYIYMLCKRYTKDMLNIEVSPILNSVSNFVKTREFNISGFIQGDLIEKAFNELANKKEIKNFAQIKIPLVIPAVDINTGKKIVFTNNEKMKKENKEEPYIEYISDISIGKAIRASSSFPGVFCPCEYKKYKFLDGGILDNIPVNEVKKQGADKVIAVNFKVKKIKKNENFMDISMHTIDIMGDKISEESLKNSDFTLDIELEKIGLLDMEKIDYCFEYGYEFAMKNMDKIKSIIAQ